MGAVKNYGYDSGGLYLKRINRSTKTKCYNTWIDVLRRCYDDKWKAKYCTYRDVYLCESWHDYQVFALWYYNNYKDGYQIDKDILSDYYGEGVYYSPKTCRMIPRDLNMLLVNRVGKSRNIDTPLVVSYSKHIDKYTAWCNNGEGKTVNLGSRDTAVEAFNLYKTYKENLIKEKACNYHTKGVIDDTLYESLLVYEVDP